ncbi:MAG: hypothetical protein IJ153_07085 [Clostridia bacterium]|nr:hypothetical protein [Clostridia bacterium]
MSRPGYSKELEQRINTLNKGEAFSAYDFLDIGPAGAINRALSRFADEGAIRRIIQGVYDQPEFSNFLQEYTAPQMDQVAHALARRFKWTIAPSEDTALNILHLSTQVPAAWVYVSDGPYRSYRYNNTEINFKHKTTREIKNLSDKTLLMIQALRGLGKDHVTEESVKIMRRFFSKDDREIIMKEMQSAPTWMYSAAAKVFTKDGDDQ